MDARTHGTTYAEGAQPPAPIPASAAAPLIEIRGLTKRFDGFALQGVNLVVEPGSVVGFIGKNGAGKSTTIKSLLGMVYPDAGDVRLLGVPVERLDGAGNAEAMRIKEQVGVVFDAISLPEHLKIAEVGRLMRRAYATWDEAAFARYLAAFDLDVKKTVKDLSRGMGMKLSLACALSHHARLLILDEATAGLDPMARDEVLDLLRDFVAVEDAAGNPVNAIFMSSHITSDLDKIADTIVCIDEGRVLFSVTKDEVTDQMGVARCRAADVETVRASGLFGPGELIALRHDYGIDLGVPDRFAFERAFPGIPCDRMTIDDYMALRLKSTPLM